MVTLINSHGSALNDSISPSGSGGAKQLLDHKKKSQFSPSNEFAKSKPVNAEATGSP